jgi:hypothetical protein
MTTLTVDINNEKDLPVLKEILDRFGLTYHVNEQYDLTDAEIQSLLNTQKDFLEGKTTARNWKDIEDDLNSAYS